MASTLAEHYSNTNNSPGLDALANLMLEYEPNCLEGIQTKAAAYDAALEVRYRKKYGSFENVPIAEREAAKQLIREMHAWDNKAKALGWRPPSKEFEARNQRAVRDAKQTK